MPLNMLRRLPKIDLLTIMVFLFGYTCFFYQDLVIYIIIILTLSLFITNRQYKVEYQTVKFLIVLFMIYLIGNSLILGSNFYDEWSFLFPGAVFFLLSYRFPASRLDFWQICYGLVFVGFIVAFEGVLEFAFFGNKFWFNINPNHLGGFLAAIFPVAIGCALGARSNLGRIFHLAASALIMAAIIITSCRGSLLAVACALVFMAIFLKNIWLIPVYSLHSYLVSLVTTDVFSKRVVSVVASRTIDSSTAQRLRLWHAAWRIFEKNPLFGCGLGNYQTLSLKQGIEGIPLWSQGISLTAHNSYLQILAELGAVGLAIFITILLLLVSPIFKYLSRSVGRQDILLVSFSAGLLAYLAQNMTNSLVLQRPESAIGWILMGMASCRLRFLCLAEKN